MVRLGESIGARRGAGKWSDGSGRGIFLYTVDIAWEVSSSRASARTNASELERQLRPRYTDGDGRTERDAQFGPPRSEQAARILADQHVGSFAWLPGAAHLEMRICETAYYTARCVTFEGVGCADACAKFRGAANDSADAGVLRLIYPNSLSLDYSTKLDLPIPDGVSG